MPLGAAVALQVKAFYAFRMYSFFLMLFFYLTEVVLDVLKSSKPLVANISAELEMDPEGSR